MPGKAVVRTQPATLAQKTSLCTILRSDCFIAPKVRSARAGASYSASSQARLLKFPRAPCEIHGT